MTEPTDKGFRQQLRHSLQEAEEALSPEVIRALQQARNKAVAATGKRSGFGPAWGWAGGTAAVLLAVVLSLQPGSQGSPGSLLEDMAILAADEELELYQDLEFYDWLAETQQHG